MIRKYMSSLSISSLLLSLLTPMALFITPVSAAVDTCTWIGGTDTNFSTAANWSCSVDGSAAPEAGDTLQFTQIATTTTTTNLLNDIPTTEFAGIIVDVTENTIGVTETYWVDALLLADGAAITTTGTADDTGVEIVSTFTLSGDFTVTAATNDVVDWYNSSFNGTGNFTVQDNLLGVILRGSYGDIAVGDNAYVTVRGSTLGYDINSLTVGASEIIFDMYNQVTSPVINVPLIAASSRIGFAKAQWFDTTWKSAATNYTYSGSVTLNGNLLLNPGIDVSVNFTGAITKNGNTMKYDPYALGIVKVNGVELVPEPVKIMSNDKNSGSLAITKNEIITLNGERGSAYVYDGGTLKGTGTVTGTVNVATGGTLAPGESPGCMTMGGLTTAGNLDVEIAGTTACTEYDQAIVNGAVNLTGSTLNISLLSGFTPALNNAFVIINNDGTDAITGTFNGLADGATFDVAGYTFQVNYNAGDGNDVVLLATELPDAPDTGVGSLMTNPIYSLIAVVLALGVIGGLKYTHRT